MNERILSDDEIAALRKHWSTAPTVNEAAKRLGISRETARSWARKLGLTRPVRSDWSDERVDLLKNLWAQGVSASNIAARLGGEISRNAVLGKVHRMGIVVRGQRTKTYGKSVRAKKRLMIRHATTKLELSVFGKARAKFKSGPPTNEDRQQYKVAIEQTNSDIARVKFLELEPHHCRFGVGDPRKPGFGFCGLERIPGSAYCGHHHSRTHTPVPVRTRPEPVTAPSEKVDA